MRILGLSAFYHDSATALLVDGDILVVREHRTAILEQVLTMVVAVVVVWL